MSSTSPPCDRSGTAVYICHCGHNIAATVDVEAVAQGLEGRPGIALVRHYPYLCSRPGQDLIRQDLEAGRAQRVVVAACSPRMHEATFRKVLAEAGTNPYLFRHVNIREQCSWVHPDRADATAKAADLIAMGLARVRQQEPLEGSEAPVTPRALVLGGGPAGLAAAADLGHMGLEVVLVETADRIGGRARDLGRSFPEGGEVGPWLEERVQAVEASETIEVLTATRLTELEGAPGSFRATLETPAGPVTREVGAVITATGSALYRPDDPEDGRPELGSDHPQVITQEELEGRLRAANAPLVAGAKNQLLDAVTFVQCVGSRDQTAGAGHCSRVCCMVSVRQAEEVRARHPDARVEVLYMDLRAYARGAEEAYEAAARNGVVFRRAGVSEVFPRGEKVAVRCEDTLLGRAEERDTDLVVLACGARPRPDAAELARLLRIPTGPDGFFLEAHPKLRPSETHTQGIYLAGACQGPKTLDEAVTSGRAAAAKAAAALLRGRVDVDPVVAEVDPDRCAGCGLCAAICPTGALELREHLPVMAVESALCKGCGACAAVCPAEAVSLRHYRGVQVLAEVEGAMGGRRKR